MRRLFAFFESMSAIAVLGRLECAVADLTQSYDEVADHYDLIFENWEASLVRQLRFLPTLSTQECGGRQPISVLDCGCGIGTQSLGLAMKGFDVHGCDISSGAVQAAQQAHAKLRESGSYLERFYAFSLFG